MFVHNQTKMQTFKFKNGGQLIQQMICNRNTRFMCLFIAKIWWMIPRVGNSGSDIPKETQMLLLEVGQECALGALDDGDDDDHKATTEDKFYVLVLPTVDGAFRTTLQGSPQNDLQFCYESGLYFTFLA